MDGPAVIICKPGAVRPKDRAALAEAGVIVIETENPIDVRVVNLQPAVQELSHGALLTAAAEGILSSCPTKSAEFAFGDALARAIQAAHKGRV